MRPIDCWMCKTRNRWHSVDAYINHIKTAFVHSIMVCNQSYHRHWPPSLSLYVLSFASGSFVTSQFLIECYLRYLTMRWRGPISFPRFRPAIDGMWFISLVFGKYSSTSSPFLIRLFLLDFHDVLQEISNISPMCTRSVRRVMQFDTWMHLPWRMSFRSIRHAHWPLFLWNVWHRSLKFWYHISSLILLLHCHFIVTCRKKLLILAILQCDVNSRTFTWCIRPLHMQRQIIMSHNFVTEIKNKLTRSEIGKQLAFQRDRTSQITVCISILPQTQEPSPSLRRNPISIW